MSRKSRLNKPVKEARHKLEAAGGSTIRKQRKKLDRTWSRRIRSTDVLATIAHHQFTLDLGPVSFKQIYRHVEQRLCDTLPGAFSVLEMEARVADVLSEPVEEGQLGYALIEPSIPKR